MDAQSFWQNILLILVGLLQSMVNLVIWEKHQPKTGGASTASGGNQNSQDSQ